jgi:hypothetical protein
LKRSDRKAAAEPHLLFLHPLPQLAALWNGKENSGGIINNICSFDH